MFDGGDSHSIESLDLERFVPVRDDGFSRGIEGRDSSVFLLQLETIAGYSHN